MLISQKRIDGAEPMRVLGMSEAGDYLVEDRHGRIGSVKGESLYRASGDALDEPPVASVPETPVQEIVEIVTVKKGRKAKGGAVK